MSSLTDEPKRGRPARPNNLRRILMFAIPGVLLLIVAPLLSGSFGQVKPGYVGLKINQYGSGAGLSPQVLGVGTYFTPPGTTIQEFPVFTQNYTYTASTAEGSANNEEFVFQDKSGLTMSTDIGLSYSCLLYTSDAADE